MLLNLKAIRRELIGMTVYVNGLKKADFGLPGIREIDAYKVEE